VLWRIHFVTKNDRVPKKVAKKSLTAKERRKYVKKDGIVNEETKKEKKKVLQVILATFFATSMPFFVEDKSQEKIMKSRTPNKKNFLV
jgi:hypothetical protein